MEANGTHNTSISAAYFIWRKPYMVAASGTFIDDMLRRAGFRNAFAGQTRYPEISAEQLAAAAPQRILLSSEPYPFADKHMAEFQAICPNAKIEIVDGELFSWYGSRLQKSAAYFNQLR
jgi:ABC-type Fe3+-hydroxamate transport system substrate-binding protein